LDLIRAAAADDASNANALRAGSASLVVTKTRLEKHAEDNQVDAQSKLDWIHTTLGFDFRQLYRYHHSGFSGTEAVDFMPYVDVEVLNLFKGVHVSCLRNPNDKINPLVMYGLCSHFAQRHALCGFTKGSLKGHFCVEVSDYIDGTGGVSAALKSMRDNPCAVGDVWNIIAAFRYCLMSSPSETVYPPVDMSAEPF
jgi:hypothetical protein